MITVSPAAAGDGQVSASRGVAVIAHVFGVLGVAGIVAGALQLAGTVTADGGALNPVFDNARRLPHVQAIQSLASGYPVSFTIVAAWYLAVVLLTILLVALVRAVHRRAPAAALTAGIFVAGAAISGLLIGTSVLKVAELAVQAAAASGAEQEWLRAGVNFMNQLHLFFVSGWQLSLALAWIFLGFGAVSWNAQLRVPAASVLIAGAIALASVIARQWLPVYGPEAPRLLVAMTEPLATFAAGAGLAGCTLLWRALPRP
jgi:hypothetical protein